MDMVRRVTAAADLERALARERGKVLLWSCADVDTAVAAAALGEDRRRRHFGLWLEASGDYPAAIIARDVKTLAALVPVEHVVVGAALAPRDHAAVVTALLGGGPVDLANEAATLRRAYSRPVPRTPVRVWALEDGRLTSEGETLFASATGSDELGEWTTFSSAPS
jgi:hypothetical protein